MQSKELCRIEDNLVNITVANISVSDMGGMCNMISKWVIEDVNNFAKQYQLPMFAELIHGEFKHNTKLVSDMWSTEHTMVKVTLGRHVWYCDATCYQFYGIIKYMPKFYVSHQIPEWFYPDEKNPRWWLPKSFSRKHPKIDKIYGKLITFIQYDVWGSISDIIHVWIKNNRKG